MMFIVYSFRKNELLEKRMKMTSNKSFNRRISCWRLHLKIVLELIGLMLNRSYLQHFIEDSIHHKNKSCFIPIMLTRQNLQENNFLLAVTSQNCLRRPLKIIAKSFNQFLRINHFFFSFDILSQYNENKKIQITTLRYFVTKIFPHNTTFCSFCSG